MDARTQRTLIRVGTMIGALIICTIVVVVFPNLDPRFIAAVYSLGATAALGLDQWIKNSGGNAPPTVDATTEALQKATGNPLVGVTPPKHVVEKVVTLPSEPRKPFDTL